MSDDPFVVHRSLLFTVTHEMLGSAADAEDVVQEAWLRWAATDRADGRDPRSYVIRIVARKALDRLRVLGRQREDYVGEWLPDPLLMTPDVADDVELAENVSIAMLTVLETLGPPERAVLEQFTTALTTGDVEGLLDVLAADVVIVSDGGGEGARRTEAGSWRGEAHRVDRRWSGQTVSGARGHPQCGSTALPACGSTSTTK